MRKVYLVALIVAAVMYAAAAQTTPSAYPPGAKELAGRLLQNHAYLLDPAERQELDALNRLMREGDAEERNAKTEEAKAQADAKRRDAAQRLFALLEKSGGTLRMSVAGGAPSLSRIGPLNFPGNAGAMLMRVDTGAGDTRFFALDRNLGLSSESGLINIDVSAKGTTWVLVSFTNAPFGKSYLRAEFKADGASLAKLPVEIQTPELGRLSMQILSGESGKPVPAMVRLVWKTDGLDYRPSNAVDISPDFEGQGNSNSRRNAQLVGRLRGDYWCVPGPFDMPVQPGDWDVIIRRGPEHIPVFDSFTVAPGQSVSKSYRVERWTDMRKRGWYSGDDHVHFRIISDEDAQRLMNWVRAEDIHLANVVKMGDISRTYFEQRGFGKDYRVVMDDVTLSPGQECPRTHGQLGHTLSMNVKSMVRDVDKYYLYDWVFDNVHAQGGLSGYAHAHADFFFVHRDMTMNIPKNKVDFAEVMQFSTLGMDLAYEFFNLGYKVTLSAGSDVPWGGTVGEERVFAYLGKKRFNADAWFEAVRLGHTFVTNGPMVEFRVERALPGDTLTVEPRQQVRVRARAWGHPGGAAPTKLEILRHAEVVQQAEAAGEGRGELTLDSDVDSGYGCWLAARVQGADGSQAHTTPVYVTCEGYRFWKHDTVPQLIEKRRGNLAEIRQIVAEAQADKAQGKTKDDRARDQLAIQGPALLERVEAAEQIYKELEGTFEKEKNMRAG
ncbi:MAG: CehA/McbA family metallohydrolase [Candidatus Hydrogenedentes bacterium]|nr:CehA/McbA family metallohydrolase [Candidatus Hydrogenedentota bacterium]